MYKNMTVASVPDTTLSMELRYTQNEKDLRPPIFLYIYTYIGINMYSIYAYNYKRFNVLFIRYKIQNLSYTVYDTEKV